MTQEDVEMERVAKKLDLLDEALGALADRRATFRAYREAVDEELRLLRLEKLGAEQSNIEHLVVKAAALGATTGQIKRAYGTKDHRTVADILTRRAAEIEAMRKRKSDEEAQNDWFTVTDAGILITVGESSALFTLVEVDDEKMLTTEASLWNEDYTIRNEAVALFDGQSESTNQQVSKLVEAVNRG